MLHFSADLVLAYQHLLRHNFVFGFATIAILCAPAVISLFFTLITMDFWPRKGFVYLIGWTVLRTIQHLTFPVWAMYG